ncbi:MAG: nitroreductase family protein [archaeon]
MRVEDAIRIRHSIRRYSSMPVRFEKLAAVLDAARFAPSAGNISSIKLVLVSDKSKIKEIAQAAMQDFVAVAPHVIVVCSDNSQLARLYGERGVYMYSKQQAGAAIQNILLKVTELGLASCWVGAFDDNAIKRILTIPDNLEVEAVLPIAGKHILFRESRRKKPELKSMIYFDRWGNKTFKQIRKADAR